MSHAASGYVRALGALREAGVEFVVVGVGGVNFYARSAADAFATLELEALLEPSAANLERALAALSGLGYAFEAGGEPFLEIGDRAVLARIVARGASLSALHPEAGALDLMTSIAGFAYPELAADASPFQVGGVEVRVGRLEKLLRSKERAGRPKDLEFLRMFEANLAGDD